MGERSISAIVPVRNGERYIAEAVESILGQSVPPYEVIVVDDGSTDSTADIVAAMGGDVRLVRKPGGGAASARNRGVEASTGELLAFLDADDLWSPDRLELGLGALLADPSIDIVFGMVQQFRSPELEPGAVVVPERLQGPLIGHHSGTMLLRRSTFDEVGWFAEENLRGCFLDWFARALDMGLRMEVLPDVVMHRRLHLDNLGRMEGTGPEQYAVAIRAMLRRRAERR